ncbi:nucleotidyltransferase domain-containing protein [Candidatus Poribacteria bacterium]|nr:nucleotidyltransferase domain-containing protein [Candidatus Poribacteria bacterium]
MRQCFTLQLIIKLFAEELKIDIFVEKILLFGSYAKGNPDANSDIDLIVVSFFFLKGKHILHKQYLLYLT